MIIDFYNRGGGGTPSSGGTSDVTKAEVKRMIASSLDTYTEDIENGNPIVGLAKNLNSPDGVTNQDTFIMRTTAGDDSVSTGPAKLMQVKGHTLATRPFTGHSESSYHYAQRIEIGPDDYGRDTLIGIVPLQEYPQDYMENGDYYYYPEFIYDGNGVWLKTTYDPGDEGEHGPDETTVVEDFDDYFQVNCLVLPGDKFKVEEYFKVTDGIDSITYNGTPVSGTIPECPDCGELDGQQGTDCDKWVATYTLHEEEDDETGELYTVYKWDCIGYIYNTDSEEWEEWNDGTYTNDIMKAAIPSVPNEPTEGDEIEIIFNKVPAIDPEYITLTQRQQVAMSVDYATFRSEASESYMKFSYNGSAWSPAIANYGITLTGTSYNGDFITVVSIPPSFVPMQDATPESFTALGLNSFDKDNADTTEIDGVTYYIVKAVGGLVDGYVIYGGSGATITGGVAETDNASAITTTSGVTTLVVYPTTAATYIYFTTNGNIGDVCVHPQWSGYRNEEFEKYNESEVVLPTKDVSGNTLPPLISVGNTANVMDLENGIFIQNIEVLTATPALIRQYIATKTWGVDYYLDESHIYRVLANPVEIPMEEVNNLYEANDFSIERFNGTEVSVPAVTYYMTNLVDKLRVDVLTRSNIVRLTQSQYDNLQTKDPNTQYIITDANAVDMDSYKDIVDCTEDGLPEEGVVGKVYLKNGRYFRWVEEDGNWGEWILSNDDKYKSLKYSVIPSSLDGQVLFRLEHYSTPYFYAVYNETAQTITMKEGDPETGTTKTVINFGDVRKRCETNYTFYGSFISWVDGLITMEGFGTYGKITNQVSTSIQVGHYESVDDPTLVSRSFVTASNGQPIWNEQGAIVGKVRDIHSVGFKLNPNASYNTPTSVLADHGNAIGPFFAPTAGGGGAGYILQSGGEWAAPTWVTLASMMGGLTIWCGSQDDYDAIATHDANTLYIIND